MSKFRLKLSPLPRAFALGVVVAVVAATTGYAPLAQAADTKDSKEPKCAAGPKFQEKYKVAVEAAQKQDWAAALPAAKESFKVAKQPCEQVAAVSIQRSAAYNLDKTGDEVVAAAELMNTLPGVPDTDKIQNLGVVLQARMAHKDYDKAIPAMKAYIAAGGGNPDTWNTLVELQHQQEDCAGMLESLAKITEKTPPTERQLLLKADCSYKAKDTATTQAVNEELLKRFPKENYMFSVLAQYAQGDELQLLNLYRLAFAKGFLTKQAQLVDFAALLSEKAGIPAEAQRVLEKAAAEKWITLDDKNTKQLAAVKRNAAEDKKSLAALDKDAKAGSSGKKDIAVGYTYFGFEDYANAIDAIKRGLSAGRVSDVKRPDDANMVLGIALLKSGKVDEAAAAFAAAKSDPRMAKAAELWSAIGKN